MTHRSLITRVVLHNYKSVRRCSARLQPATFLIGHSASGKSNFLDAIQFVADALNGTLEQAVEKRGGISAVRHKHRDDDPFVRFRVEMTFADGGRAHYAFELEHVPFGCRARNEECVLYPAGAASSSRYRGTDETVIQPHSSDPLQTSGRELFLASKFVMPEFHMVRDALARNRIYNLNPASLKTSDLIQGDPVLAWDGRNLARVLWQMKEGAPESFVRVAEYLGKVFPPLYAIDFKHTWLNELQKYDLENGEVGICLIRKGPSPRQLWNLPASSLSDGTLRALGVLAALFQSKDSVALIGIEEPENAVHPAALRVLLDALNEASQHRQICVASHSPDLVNAPDIATDSILPVENCDGETIIGSLDQSGRAALARRLYALNDSHEVAPETRSSEAGESEDFRIFDASNGD